MRVARRGRASHPEAIATLTNNVRSVTAVRDYTATLATVMQESEDLRVALSSRRPRAGSDTSDDDGDGEAAEDQGTEALHGSKRTGTLMQVDDPSNQAAA